MVRTVKVRLELDRDDYKRGLRDAAGETRGFDGEVRTLGKDVHATGIEVKAAGTQVEAMGREVDTAAGKTSKLGDEADKARTKTRGFGEETDKTRTKTRGFGEESDKTKAKIVDLAKEITTTKTALVELGEEFQRTGKVNVDELGRLSRSLRDLELAKAAIGKLVPGDEGPVPGDSSKKNGLLDFAIDEALVKGVKAAGKGVNDAWEGIWKAAANNPVVSTAIVAGLVVGAPLIIATIGGAIASGVALGVGGGVMALGISRAVKDARVSAAWSELADTAAKSLDKSSGRFVEPLVRSAHRFEDAWTDDVMPHIDSAMVALAPKLDDLTDSAVKFVQNVGPGFDSAVEAAGPFIDLLSEHLPEIGDSISSFLGHLENAGPGAEMFFDDLLTLTEETIRALGWLVEKGAATYEVFAAIGFLLQGDVRNAAGSATDGFFDLIGSGEKVNRVGETAAGVFQKVTAAIVPVGKEASITGAQFTTLSGQINATAQTSDVLAGQMAGKLFNSMMSVDQATLGFAESQTSLSKSIEENGRQLDIHKEKGQANREAILGAVQANMAQYQANIAVGMSATDAALAYDTNTKALEDQLRAAHFTQGEIDGLIGKYRGVPAKVNTDIAMKGLTEAINGLEDVIRMANGLSGRVVRLTVEETRRTTYTSDTAPSNYFRGNRWGGAYEHAAVGTLREASVFSTASPARYAFAEPQTGGEAFVPRNGDYGRSMSILSQAASWYGARVVPATGGGGPTINVYPPAGASTQEIVAEVKRELAWNAG